MELDESNLNLSWDVLEDESKINTPNEKVEVADALIMSLTNYGQIDMRYICDITGKDVDECIKELHGSIYQNPLKWRESKYDGWETSDEYLSGNLVYKYSIAKLFNEKYNGYFISNIKALKSVVPEKVLIDDIYVTLGTPWLPVEFVEKYICNLLEIKSKDFIVHDQTLGTWEVKTKSYVAYHGNHIKIDVNYGTSKMSALHIIEKMLNNQAIVVYDYNYTYNQVNKSKQRVINSKETMLANEKANIIRADFANYVKGNPERIKYIEKLYRINTGMIRRRVFNGSFLTFPGINKDITLYPYQKNAIARILFTPNTLLAHDVGTGKTYIMIAAGQELRRMGISKKNLYIVPNNIIPQWQSSYKELYPNANVKVISPNEFTPAKRVEILKDIKNTDYDAIIMAYSSFDMIELSKEFKLDTIQSELDKIEDKLRSHKIPLTGSLKAKIKALEKEHEEISLDITSSKNVYFDELGINTIFVDEAHNYKNIPFDTQSQGVLGLNSEGSDKCKNFYEKIKCVQKHNHGRGVVFATGTPITNSISDIYIMQLCLQSSVLAQLNLLAFDAWAANFAEMTSNFEVDVDTSKFRITSRFAKFHNLTELTSMLSLIADFHSSSKNKNLPEFDGYSDIVVPTNPYLKQYLEEISERADKVRNHDVSRKEDNMLKITTDGRKAALDVRLVMDEATKSVNSKVYACSENIYHIYLHTKDEGGTQLVFCDSSTPKEQLNMYDEIKDQLVEFGIPADEIAFIHDGKSEKSKAKILDDTKNSKIRVLIGSTWKLGVGVNVQDHLIAIHHLDIPWRPADMVQREGRIIRPGNLNKKVYIYRYITEGSFDAYSWQLLETKQRFINDILAGSLVERDEDDVSDTILKYSEIKALAIGNPLIKTRVELANDLTKLVTLKKRNDEVHQELLDQNEQIPAYIQLRQDIVSKAESDFKFIKASDYKYESEYTKALGIELSSSLKDNILENEDRRLFEYKGFEVVLPKDMIADKPYIILQREGKYKVDMSYSDTGVITRLNNFIENFDKVVDDNKVILKRLKVNLETIKEELKKTNDYVERIQAVKEKLDSVDKQLGVKGL